MAAVAIFLDEGEDAGGWIGSGCGGGGGGGECDGEKESVYNSKHEGTQFHGITNRTLA